MAERNATHCAYCGKPHGRSTGHVNRSLAQGLRLYCSRKCSGLGRRKGKSKAQRVEEKRLYDIQYRRKNRAMLKAKKAAYYQRTRDPEKERQRRQERMHLHVEYCRRPEYRLKKKAYDEKRRDSEYGPFAEAARLAINLNREIKERMSRHEIYTQNETLNKKQTRTRKGSDAYTRDRHSRT